MPPKKAIKWNLRLNDTQEFSAEIAKLKPQLSYESQKIFQIGLFDPNYSKF